VELVEVDLAAESLGEAFERLLGVVLPSIQTPIDNRLHATAYRSE
jgi:hypothetical protein